MARPRCPLPARAAILAAFMVIIAQLSHCHEEDLVATSEVEAVVGRATEMPCDIEPDSNDDRVYMVLWFRQSGGKPLYSFDVRGRSFAKALHWSDPLAFGRRAYFLTVSRPAILAIETTQPDDEGVYRCRVDFKNSPTRNFQIRLVTIVPPHQLLLYDENERDIAGVVGPLREGGNFTLYCELRGGRPEPALVWTMNETRVLPHEVVRRGHMLLVTRVRVALATRDWLNTNVRCQASNTRLTAPHSRSARIEMHLEPMTVSIFEQHDIMNENKSYEINCLTTGSRPPAQIYWFRDKQRYVGALVQKEYINESYTLSTMQFRPRPDDDNALLRCVAVNSALGVSKAAEYYMTIIYKPVVSVSLGSTLNPQDIKEGDDVYFECHVKANPKEYRIDWYKSNQSAPQPALATKHIVANISEGIFISNKSLVLQKVHAKTTGLYFCKATNDFGETKSLPVFLRVLHVPICATDSPVTLGVRLHEHVRIRCHILADPEIRHVTWGFNNSIAAHQIHEARSQRFYGSETVSELHYHASSERDYGVISCNSNNTVGKMKEPCLFHVVPATRPSPVEGCKVYHRIKDKKKMASIRCSAGYDGGLSQYFTVDAFTILPRLVNQRVIRNFSTTENSPLWFNLTAKDLESLRDEETLAVVAHNEKGSSEPFMLNNFSFKQYIVRPTDLPTLQYSKLVIWIVVGVISVIAVILATAALIYYCKRPREQVASDKPGQSMVQLDGEGRGVVVAYTPTPPPQPEETPKPDVAVPTTSAESEPRRVVLEARENRGYTIRPPLRSPLRPREPCLGSDDYTACERPPTSQNRYRFPASNLRHPQEPSMSRTFHGPQRFNGPPIYRGPQTYSGPDRFPGPRHSGPRAGRKMVPER